jgi:hypothetical protein
MKASPGRRSFVALALVLLLARGARAGDLEFAPFAGLQYAGSVATTTGRGASIGSGLAYGATLDVALNPQWQVELLYSRQETSLSSSGESSPFDLKVERYMAGIQEDKGDERTRFFGVFLLGLTRFAPGFGGYDADERFTLGLTLGLKHYLSDRFGVRAEARGFFAAVDSGGGTVCRNGNCLFVYSASGLWQGDVSAAVLIRF